jgi:hypothetical protein
MQRGSGNRTLYTTKPSFNLNELTTLMEIKIQIRTIVQSYIDKKSDRDMTLSTLAQISKDIKEKISKIS